MRYSSFSTGNLVRYRKGGSDVRRQSDDQHIVTFQYLVPERKTYSSFESDMRRCRLGQHRNRAAGCVGMLSWVDDQDLLTETVDSMGCGMLFGDTIARR